MLLEGCSFSFAKMYTKQQLFTDINELVERYIEQELALKLPAVVADIVVESDSEGDNVDTNTGDIWDLDNQKIVGRKLESKQKEWFDDEFRAKRIVKVAVASIPPQVELPKEIELVVAEPINPVIEPPIEAPELPATTKVGTKSKTAKPKETKSVEAVTPTVTPTPIPTPTSPVAAPPKKTTKKTTKKDSTRKPVPPKVAN